MTSVYNYLLFVCIVISGLIYKSDAKCPNLCSICLSQKMVCNVTGLPRIDANIPTSIRILEYDNQYIFQKKLTASNFTEFSDKFQITHLTLQHTSISELAPYVFRPLRDLRYLDLSFHGYLKIYKNAFYNLRLDSLQLNNIGRLGLTNDSFKGARITKLYMENSRLTKLDYQMFEPILSSLKELYLKQNQIHQIDRKFNVLFGRLSVINLKENPLVCYCDMLWLNKLLKQKHRHDGSANNDLYPTCVAPTNLRKRLLHDIDENEFNCYIPKISQIDIDIETDNLAKMTCKVNPSQSSDNTPVKVYWTDPSKSSIPIRDIENSYSEMATYRINNYQNGYNKNLKCIAKNLIGNNSVIVYISWLKAGNTPKSTPKKTTDKSVSNSVVDEKDVYKQNYGVINPDLNTSSYLFQKQYTLLEMTSAVIGTFIITVLFFFIFYRFYTNRHYGYKSGKKSLNYTLHTEPPNTHNNNNIDLQNPYNSQNNMDSAMITPNYSINSNTKFFPFNTISILPNNNNNNNHNNNTNQHNNPQHNTISKNHGNTLGFNLDEVSSHYSNNSQTYDSINNHPPIIANPNNINTTPNNNLNHNTPNPNSPGYLSNLTNSPSAHFIDYKTHRNLYHPGTTTAQMFNNNNNIS